MANAARIDNVILHPDGRVEVLKTEGPTPLPVAPGGSGVIWSSRQAFVEALAAAEALISTDLLALVQLATGYKVDPNIGAAFITRVKGKTATLDLTGVVAPITVQ